MEKIKRVEFDTTGQMFGFGFAWSGYPNYMPKEKFVAIIIGCFVIRINLNVIH